MNGFRRQDCNLHAHEGYQAKVEKLRKEAAECALIRDLASDHTKREMFDRLASHLTVLADQVEMAMIESGKRHD
jgi:hypothetical protein